MSSGSATAAGANGGDDLYGLPSGTLGRKISILALPLLGEQLLTLMCGLVDTLLAGMVNKEATAAVGTATYVWWMLGLLFTLVSIGVRALISRSIGAHDIRTANRALGQSLILAVLFGLVVTALGFLLASRIAALLLATASARVIAREYLAISASSYAMIAVIGVIGAALRAAGDARTPLYIMAVVNAINILVSVVASLTLSYGVVGIVMGDVISRAVGAVVSLLVLVHGRQHLKLRLADLVPDRTMLGRILRVGLPALGDGMVTIIGQIGLLRIIAMTAMGDASVAVYAAHLVAVRTETITFIVATSWGTAGATIAGQYLGAHRVREALRAGHLAAAQGVAISVAIGAAFYLFAGPIYAVMTGDPAVREIGVPAFRMMGLAQPLMGAVIIYSNCLKGVGDTRWPMAFSIVGGLFVRLPLAYLGGITLGGGLLGAWCGMWSDYATRCFLVFFRYCRGTWQKVTV